MYSSARQFTKNVDSNVPTTFVYKRKPVDAHQIYQSIVRSCKCRIVSHCRNCSRDVCRTQGVTVPPISLFRFVAGSSHITRLICSRRENSRSTRTTSSLSLYVWYWNHHLVSLQVLDSEWNDKFYSDAF